MLGFIYLTGIFNLFLVIHLVHSSLTHTIFPLIFLGLTFKILLNIEGGKNNAQNIKDLPRMYTDLICVYFVYMHFVKQGNCLPSTENKPVPPHPAFYVDARIQTQMLTLVWQVLFSISYFPSLSLHTYFFYSINRTNAC